MATLPQIVFSIKEKLSGFKLNDDFKLDDKYIIMKCNEWRSTLITDLYNNKIAIDGKYYQRICCIEVSCNKLGCSIGGNFYYSGELIWEAELPERITEVGELDILYFGKDDFKKSFSRKSFDGWVNNKGNLRTGYDPMYTIVGSQSYFKNLPTHGIKFLCLIALLKDPTTACNWVQSTEEYPVPSAVKLEILVVKDIVSLWGIQPDKLNNGDDGNEQIPSNQIKQNQEE